MKVAPSMLACDYTKIGEEIKKVSQANADMIHQDVMDGVFVPNISFGASVIKAMRPLVNTFFDVHLMIEKPSRYIDDFIDAGADNITIHIEAENDVHKVFDYIISKGIKASLCVKPGTPIECVYPYLDKLFMVLIMTVEPGFGGQVFMNDMMDKVKKLKCKIIENNLNVLIEVDGGININTAKIAQKAGADIVVAGTSIFKANNINCAIKSLQNI